MKLSLLPDRLFVLLLLTLLLVPGALSAAPTEQQQTTTATETTPTAQQPAKEPSGPAEFEALRRLYQKKDPTGVRARLGMCRRLHQKGRGRMGQGRGYGRGWRHGMQPGPRHRWQQEDREWKTQQ
ncbi:hypothetical protein JWJ90_19980 [Desulfobulbus rhabdoformis]|uniref:hypothetical protein n=1 Tax=Desulfobulbus rhabdoformis TaxID=34032 RepID=UPI001964942C|nr:hypothetical protein [Desulfobulbus rhabdoformis]MBM9616549.1 hypothetical protein [Desulfobulbus rhabdoformis]